MLRPYCAVSGGVAARAQNRLRIAQLEQLTQRSALVRGARVVRTGDPVAHPIADVDRAVVLSRRHHAVVHPSADYRITGYFHFVLEVHPDLVLMRATVDLARRVRGPWSHGELGHKVGDPFAEGVAQQGVVLALGHGLLLRMYSLVHDEANERFDRMRREILPRPVGQLVERRSGVAGTLLGAYQHAALRGRAAGRERADEKVDGGKAGFGIQRCEPGQTTPNPLRYPRIGIDRRRRSSAGTRGARGAAPPPPTARRTARPRVRGSLDAANRADQPSTPRRSFG